jgi:hypothetical protein
MMSTQVTVVGTATRDYSYRCRSAATGSTAAVSDVKRKPQSQEQFHSRLRHRGASRILLYHFVNATVITDFA